MTNQDPGHSTEDIAKAIYTVNRHAKTAPDPKFLYSLKKGALEKLISAGDATKVGLHFSNNPRFSKQHTDLVVQVGEFVFHIPPTKNDFKELPHLGELDNQYRNPKVKMPLGKAKAILSSYTGITNKPTTPTRKKYQKPVFKRLGESYHS